MAIKPIVGCQLNGVHTRPSYPKQSTAFYFTRFLVPHWMGYQGWAIFMYCYMLARGDIAELWALHDDQFAMQCVQHEHVPGETVKFLGEVQSAYPKKNWSSLCCSTAAAALLSRPGM